jgi:hypothetical protein
VRYASCVYLRGAVGHIHSGGPELPSRECCPNRLSLVSLPAHPGRLTLPCLARRRAKAYRPINASWGSRGLPPRPRRARFRQPAYWVRHPSSHPCRYSPRGVSMRRSGAARRRTSGVTQPGRASKRGLRRISVRVPSELAPVLADPRGLSLLGERGLTYSRSRRRGRYPSRLWRGELAHVLCLGLASHYERRLVRSRQPACCSPRSRQPIGQL